MKTLKKRRHRKYNGQRGGFLEWLFGKNKEKEPEPGEDPKLESGEHPKLDSVPESEQGPDQKPDPESGEEDYNGEGGRRRRYIRKRSSRRKRRVSKKY